jgi:hypothetical protein
LSFLGKYTGGGLFFRIFLKKSKKTKIKLAKKCLTLLCKILFVKVNNFDVRTDKKRLKNNKKICLKVTINYHLEK